MRQDLSFRKSRWWLRSLQNPNYAALNSRHRHTAGRLDPQFASQSVRITRMGFSESTADHDKTAPDAHEGSRHNSTSAESEGYHEPRVRDRASSLQSRARYEAGSHHCSCRPRPTARRHSPPTERSISPSQSPIIPCSGARDRCLPIGKRSPPRAATMTPPVAGEETRPTRDESLWSISWWRLLILAQRLPVPCRLHVINLETLKHWFQLTVEVAAGSSRRNRQAHDFCKGKKC